MFAACDVAGAPLAASPMTLPPPETSTIRITSVAACDPWAWICEPFLREEGFTDIQYPVAREPGRWDVGTVYAQSHVLATDVGLPGVAVAGLHTGCVEVFAGPGIATIADLRGKRIGVSLKSLPAEATGPLAATGARGTIPTIDYGFFVSLFAEIGMRPTDALFVEAGPNGSPFGLFRDGKVDAFITLGHLGSLVRSDPTNTARVILDITMDSPWSQYYCCLLIADRDWARANPTAVKRATRAILRAIDEVAGDRTGAARAAIDKKIYPPQVTERLISDTIADLSYDWRDHEPGDTIRFYALRLAEADLVKKSPQQLIAEGTDFAWFHELRRELKP